MFNKSHVLVAGGTGLIGRPLVRMLMDAGAYVRVASLEKSSDLPGIDHYCCDLTRWEDCCRATKDIDFVFHLASPKGSGSSARSRSAFFYVTNLLINTHLIEAAHKNKVQRFLYASTMHVYNKTNKIRNDDGVIVFSEEDATVENNWGGSPYISEHCSGLWAKRMGELHAKVCAEEYGWDKIAIVRPTTVYGPYDNFDKSSSFLIPDLIRKCFSANGEIHIKNIDYGRDFVYCDDAAAAMLSVMEHYCCGRPVNIGGGRVYTTIEVLKTIMDILGVDYNVLHETSIADKSLLDISLLKDQCFFVPKVSLYNGLKETVSWFQCRKHN